MTPGPRHIVLLMASYPPDTFGGAEQHSRILARAFVKQGVRATIVAPTQTPTAAGTRVEEGVDVVRFFTRHPPFLGGRKLGSLISWWRQAYDWIANHRDSIDVIAIQHLRLHSLPGIRAGVKFNKIISGKLGRGGEFFDLTLLRSKRVPIGHWLLGLIKRSDVIYCANSQEIVQDLHREGVKKESIFEIPNGVECPEARQAAFADAEGCRRFVFAGRVEQEKGIPQLVEAFAKIAARYEKVRLDIFGSGPMVEVLKARVLELGMYSCIRFKGVVSDRDQIYGGGTFFVLPSDSEGMSNALLEAMAYGVVPIITMVSGATDLVTPGESGFLLPDNRQESIEAALEAAMATDNGTWRSLSERAWQKMRLNYSIDEIAAQYLKLYNGKMTADGVYIARNNKDSEK